MKSDATRANREHEATDESLVQSAANGDALALATLYDRHAPVLLATARRILKDGRDAEDLVHDVFVEVWRCAGEYDPTRSTVRRWLLVRARSRAIDRVRAKLRTRAVLERIVRAHVDHEPDDPSLSPDRTLVRAALASLPFELRVLVELGYFAGMSCSEIADRLSIPLGTVKSRTARAMRQLRARIVPAASAA